MDRHSLLSRQLRRLSTNPEELARAWDLFLDAVDDAYKDFDLDRGMLERALDLSSQELRQSNDELLRVRDDLESRVHERTQELSVANEALTNEIAERERFEAQLLYIAEHDDLTGLYNRRRFESELDTQLRLAETDSSQGAVFFMDLDQFKDVNDSLGHQAGDVLLRDVAELLRWFLRDKDVLARSGGDEFALLLPRTSAAQAAALAHKIGDALRHHTFLLDHHPINVTASIGIALYPRHGSTTEELLSHADLAMYQAKSNGRSRVETYRTNRDWRSVSESRLSWRNRVSEALQHDRFVLYAQPIRSLGEERSLDYELLLRLPTERGDVVRPHMFMGVAEDFGLVQDIDRWVIRQATRIIAQQERAGADVHLAINLSGKSLGSADILSFIRSQIMSNSIDPSRLIPEVTETTAIANLPQAQRFIRSLKELGCQFSLDDFGSGFSSFSQLKHLPVDYLKIDGSFIRHVASSQVDQEIVKAMIAVARGLGKRTIAEFVGSKKTVDILREYKVDYVQGYFVGRPREVHRVLLEDSPRLAA